MHYLTGILGGHNFIYEQDMQGVHACEKKINNIFKNFVFLDISSRFSFMYHVYTT